MVDVIDPAYASVESEVVGNECIDIIRCEAAGHELFLTLIERVLEISCDILAAVSSCVLDDLAEDGYSDLLVYGCVVDIEVLEVLLGEAVPDERIGINSAVTDDLERLLIEIILIGSLNELPGEDDYIRNAGLVDLVSDLGSNDNALLGDELTVFCSNILGDLLVDDPSADRELLIELEDTYTVKIISERIKICLSHDVLGILNRERLVVADLLEELGQSCNIRISRILCIVLLECHPEALFVTEHIDDVLVCYEGILFVKASEEYGQRDLVGLVHNDVDELILIRLLGSISTLCSLLLCGDLVLLLVLLDEDP